MRNDPAWIGVHDFLKEGLTGLLERIEEVDENRRTVFQRNLARLSRLDKIRDYTYTVDQVSGDDFSVDEVVDIFNRVNSKGTPLTKADLALAHICGLWPEARAELRTFSARMEERGFGVDLNFLVRCLAGVATGSVSLEGAFLRQPAENLQTAWQKTQPAFEHLVGVLRQEAFISNLGDLATNYVLAPASVYLARQGGRFPTEAIRRRFIRWIHLAGLWGRYSGSGETKLQQDVALVSGHCLDPTHDLEAAILRERGRVTLEASDLEQARINSAVALLSRVVARSRGARDWYTGIPIFDRATGKSRGDERHYIFPKSVLLRSGFKDRTRINAVANRAVLGRKPPRNRRNLSPDEYLAEIEERQPGALQAQAVPMRRELWKTEKFLEFLAERRRLLADAMNDFIASWTPEIAPDAIDERGARRLMAEGENAAVEFKSSLRWDRRDHRVNKALERAVVKTLAGFLNADGGTLLIGVNDAGAPLGVGADYRSLRKQNRDGFELHLGQIVERDLGEAAAASFLTVNFHKIDGEDICQVSIEPSDHPIYVEQPDQATFYVRNGNATTALPVNEAVTYIGRHWGQVARS